MRSQGCQGVPEYRHRRGVLVRGHIRDNKWVDNREIFRAPNDLYTTTSDHYGSRFAFDKESEDKQKRGGFKE